VYTQRQSSIVRQLMSAAGSAVLAFASLGCAARYSPEALQAMAPAAEYAEVCARPPIVAKDSLAFAHKLSLQRTVSDDNWEQFEHFAANADVIYRYDPNASEKTMSRLPWPYQTMACRTLSARQTPTLPEGMKPLEISPEMREALISALMDRASLYLRPPPKEETLSRLGANKQYLAGGFIMGPYVDGRSPSERLEAAGQMLRDAIRFIAPKVPGPKDEQISIIDTKTGQVLGGMGAGATIGTVPGGTFIADEMLASENVPQPTREFIIGEKLGEMGSGLVQLGAGTALGAGGVAASSTGGGLVIGAPACAMGVGLIANGGITFFNGSRSLIIAICNWNELPSVKQAQPLAAVAPKDAAPSAPPPQSNAAPTPPTAAPVKPAAAAPALAAKPTPTAKPAAPAKPLPAANPTDPTVVRIRPSGTTTTERTRLKPGQKPSDTTLTVRTDAEGKVVSMEVTTTANAAPAELKPYGGPGGGHHPVAKRALEGAPNYDANKALAIPKAELERLRVKHEKITGVQMRRYKDFAKQGKPLTWEVVAEIETASLVDALMDPKMAQATVAKAIQALKESNVAGPIRIPWGK
jgi:hypothetical protein